MFDIKKVKVDFRDDNKRIILFRVPCLRTCHYSKKKSLVDYYYKGEPNGKQVWNKRRINKLEYNKLLNGVHV